MPKPVTKYVRTSGAARILGIRPDSVIRLARMGVLQTKRNARNERLYDLKALEKRAKKVKPIIDPTLPADEDE